MTQANDQNGSNRLDRIEAIMLNLATASVRHDNEFSRINSALERLERVTEQQQTTVSRIDQQLEVTASQQEINTQTIATLVAGLLELRNLVTDYLRGRSNLG